MDLLQRKLLFQSNIFQGGGGGPTFFPRGRGVKMLISIGTHITWDFPGGGVRTPYPPLDPQMIKQRITVKHLAQGHNKVPSESRSSDPSPILRSKVSRTCSLK